MIENLKIPLPRDVKGFQEAQAGGLTPVSLAQPPTPLRPTARDLLIRLGFTIGAGVLAGLIALAVLPAPDGQMPVGTAIGMLVVLGIGAYFVRRALLMFRSRFLEEVQSGYVTITFEQGSFWLAHRDRTKIARGRNVVGWDWRGLWVLDSSGNVVTRPDRSFDPPGLYPSPHSLDERELWTGHQWTFSYPDRGN